MTEIELEILRLRLRAEAHQVLLRGLYTGLANISPAVAQSCRDQFEEHSKIVIRGLSPALSEMVAAEYQEALECTLKH
jgi:hypothetical protein